MSASVELESRTDPVLRRMPSAFWRSLPVLLGIGCALLVPTLVVGVFFGAASPILAQVACVFGGPQPLRIAGVCSNCCISPMLPT